MLNKDICVLEKDGLKKFAFHLIDDEFIESQSFKDIWIDKEYPQILYCKDDYIYMI